MYCKLIGNLPRMANRHPCKITAEHVDSQRACHKRRPNPEAPVSMHAPPIRPRIWLATVAAVSFWIVLVSRHCFSVAVGAFAPPGIAVPVGKIRIWTEPHSASVAAPDRLPIPIVLSWVSSNPKLSTRY